MSGCDPLSHLQYANRVHSPAARSAVAMEAETISSFLLTMCQPSAAALVKGPLWQCPS